jgi:tRNA (guanine37-N1)-methyltransferase
MQFELLTIFPKIFESYFNTSIIKRAQENQQVKIKVHDLRKWTKDKHKTVDDRPYGGGPGMILKVEPIYQALNFLKKGKVLPKIILLTPQGKQFTQKQALRLSKEKRIILICGHYEGYDARIKNFVDEEISLGPYILTGGEVPAMALIDSVTRLIPGVIKQESLAEETFNFKNKKEYPQYTRPEVFTYRDNSGKMKKIKVPSILLSGNHQKIKEWKNKN